MIASPSPVPSALPLLVADLLEGLEDAREVLGGDAGARVLDLEAHRAPVVVAAALQHLDAQASPRRCSVNLMALPSRLSSTCISRFSSARTRSRSARRHARR